MPNPSWLNKVHDGAQGAPLTIIAKPMKQAKGIDFKRVETIPGKGKHTQTHTQTHREVKAFIFINMFQCRARPHRRKASSGADEGPHAQEHQQRKRREKTQTEKRKSKSAEWRTAHWAIGRSRHNNRNDEHRRRMMRKKGLEKKSANTRTARATPN